MKRVWRWTVGLLALTSISGQCLAGSDVIEFSRVKGKVLVNSGNGYLPAGERMPVNDGDIVMVGVEGAATIVYGESGCELVLKPASLTTVSALDPCDLKIIPASSGASSLLSTPYTWMALGGAALIGVVVYKIATFKEDNPQLPVSVP
jgi:hypothetical protein